MPQLTKRFIDTLRPTGRAVTFWDDELPGFGLRMRAGGHLAYAVKYRLHEAQAWHTLGVHGEITPAQARALARSALADVARGIDPAAKRKAARQAGNVAALAARYLEEHAEVRKKPSSVRGDKSLLSVQILPALGRLSTAAVTREHIARVHHKLRARRYTANRVVRLLSKMFNLAEDWGLRPEGSNPCRRVKFYAEERRARFLHSDELARLGIALAEAELFAQEPTDTAAVAAIRLLLFTGARAGEILGLRWEWVDLERACLRLPDSKTGRKEISLGRPAVTLLEALPRSSSLWVIPGRDPAAPLVNLNKVWRRIRKRAALDGVRLHDLRRTAASAGASVGLSLESVGQLLGHTQSQTTKRYAYLFDDAKRAAADKMSERVDAGLRKKPAKLALVQ